MPIPPGGKITCLFAFSLPAIINGVASTPGTISAFAFIPSGVSSYSDPASVPASSPAPPQLSLALGSVAGNALLGGSGGSIAGTAMLTNDGSSTAYVGSVKYLFFVSGTTYAPISGLAACSPGLSGPQPTPLAPGQSVSCSFQVSTPTLAGGMLYTKAFLQSGSTITSNSVNVRFNGLGAGSFGSSSAAAQASANAQAVGGALLAAADADASAQGTGGAASAVSQARSSARAVGAFPQASASSQAVVGTGLTGNRKLLG